MRQAPTVLGIAGCLSLALALSACAQEPPGRDAAEDVGDGESTLEVAWWGSDLRHRMTQDVIAAFEAENPDITITPIFSDWNGYWDRIAISGAASDLPDVIQMDEKYLSTYAAQEQLADLSDSGVVDTENIDPSVLPAGEIDGSLYALVASVNTYSLVANTEILDEAGVQIPDDTTWSWDDYADFTQKVSESTDADTYALQHWGMDDGGLQLWARQHGETLWGQDGGLAVSEEVLAGWWEYVLGLSRAGVIPEPGRIQEMDSSTQEQSGTATNTAALGFWWSNQFASLSDSSGQDLTLLRPPRVDPADPQTYYKPSMFWSVSAGSAHQEAAEKFVNFIVNSPQAGEILLAERGVPSNTEVRDAIADDLTANDQAVVDFINEVSDEVSPPPPMTAPGGSELETVLKRYTLQVLFESMTPQEAATKFIAEIKGMLK